MTENKATQHPAHQPLHLRISMPEVEQAISAMELPAEEDSRARNIARLVAASQDEMEQQEKQLLRVTLSDGSMLILDYDGEGNEALEGSNCHLVPAPHTFKFSTDYGYVDLGQFLFIMEYYGIGRPSTIVSHINDVFIKQGLAEITSEPHGMVNHQQSQHFTRLTSKGKQLLTRLEQEHLIEKLGVAFTVRLEKTLQQLEHDKECRQDHPGLLDDFLSPFTKTKNNAPIADWLDHIATHTP